MTKIINTRELPRDPLRCFAMTEEQAKQFTTQYLASWFYPLAQSEKGYLYVLDSEYQEKKTNE